VASAEKQLMMPPQKKFKKNTPTKTNQKDHYNEQYNEISFAAEPSQTTDQEWRVLHCRTFTDHRSTTEYPSLLPRLLLRLSPDSLEGL
jgi:hypothetical protein